MSIQIIEKKYPKKLLAIIISIILLFSIFVTALFAFGDVFNIKQGGTVVITEGMSINKTSAVMKEQGIIKFPVIFRIISRINGYDTKILPGRIDAIAGMSYIDLLKALTDPQTDITKVLIPEGLEVKEIANRLSDFVSEEEFYAALDMEYDYNFLKNIPKRDPKLEGYLFPATYELRKGMTAEEIINMMLKKFDEVFTEEYYKRAEELGMTVDEIITLASIIERESNAGDERPKVAGVFYNRLKSNMRLQSCATVQYILKERKPVLSTVDTKIQSLYNTYVNDGLPIGPIASPGEECIKAALYPEETDALYFVLGADGKHIFSSTYEEHLDAKNGD